VDKIKGVFVSNDYLASFSGAREINTNVDPIKGVNIIKPVKGKQAYATFGVGVTTQELNDALAKSGLMTMGAAHGEVTVAGGWGQAAGHGPLTSTYGLGVDQVVEYHVITPDGRLRIANSVSEPDLFWALRGGGGGKHIRN
jgi:FAD/FMN-containing dehydrogenase